MGEEFKPEENQGRSKEHVERTYMSIKLLAWFGSVLLIVLVTSLIVNYIAK
jgi:uncharacterized integral membrane protein